MENIYNESVTRVAEGARFRVDLVKRELRINGKYVIRNGETGDNPGVDVQPLDEVLANIEEMYQVYKHSIPSERSEEYRGRYFRALREEELSDEDMLYGIPREIARAHLEIYVLLCIINGSLTWDEERMGKWYWRSPSDPDNLIILRQWVEKV